MAVLNAGGSTPQPLGPLTQLAVQAGDTVTVTAYGMYQQPVQHNFFFALAAWLGNLLHPAQGAPAGVDASKRRDLPLLQVGLAAGLTQLPQLSGGVPQGYLRLLVFNRDSVLVSQHLRQLTDSAQLHYQPLRVRLLVPQDGYVTAYVGNGSDVDVLFDDVRVEHWPGVQVQEVQYDPAGLELAGLAPPSPGIRGLNNYRFNGKELQADLGLNWNHQDWRFFDPQRLQWNGVDPELENGQESWSPYSFGYDNAVRYADANGRCPTCPSPQEVSDFLVGVATAVIENELPVYTDLRDHNAPSGDSQGAYNAGLRVGDALGLVSGVYQMATGATMATGGTLATAGTAGMATPVSAPVAVGGVALAAHGAATWGKAAYNLTNPRVTDSNGRVNASSSQPGQGKRSFSNKDRAQGFEKSKDSNGVPRCEYCGGEMKPKKGSKNSYEADHRQAYANGGKSDQTNLAPACRDCNRSKGKKELNTEWTPPKNR